MSSKSFKDHFRLNQGLTAAAEKRLLVRIAERMPARINSDHLTALGFAGMLLTGVSLWATKLHPAGLLLAIFFLVVNWFGDSLDGTVARVRNKLRPRYGFYVDHILDVFGAVAILGGLALSGIMSPAIVAVFMVVYVVFNAEIFLATYTVGTFKMSYGVFGPTELRIIFAIGLVRAFFHPTVTIAGNQFLLFDVGGAIGAGVLAATLIYSVVRNARTLFAAEPLT